jgi:hypothetical protein
MTPQHPAVQAIAAEYDALLARVKADLETRALLGTLHGHRPSGTQHGPSAGRDAWRWYWHTHHITEPRDHDHTGTRVRFHPGPPAP